MYKKYFGFNEKPFSQLPDPDFLFFSKMHSDAFAMMEYGLMEQAGFTVITGEVGSGKTTLIRRLLAEIPDDVTVGLVSNIHENMDDLLRWILLAYDLNYRELEPTLLFDRFTNFVIDQYAQNRRTVLIIDGAQNLNPQMLEELRMLSNINADKYQVLQLILVGQPPLLTLLKRPEFLQFHQRITADYSLKGFKRTETHLYILHRTKHAGREKGVFTFAACDLIHKVSGGIPRVINMICDGSLFYAFSDEQEKVDVDLVQALLDDKAGSGLLQFKNDIPKQVQNDTQHDPQRPGPEQQQEDDMYKPLQPWWQDQRLEDKPVQLTPVPPDSTIESLSE